MPSKSYLISALVLAIFLVTCAFIFDMIQDGGFESDDIVATVQYGQAVIRSDGAEQTIVRKSAMTKGDTLQTYNSQVLLTISQDRFIWVHPNTTLVVRQDGGASGLTELFLTQGEVWHLGVGRSVMNMSDRVGLVTPTATIDSNNAQYRAAYDSSRKMTSTFVVDGAITFSDASRSIDIHAFEHAERTVGGTISTRSLDAEEKLFAKRQLQQDHAFLVTARDAELQKHALAMHFLKEELGASDTDIETMLSNVDRGEMTLDELFTKAPIVPNLDRVRDLTEKIRATRSVQQRLSESAQE